MDGDHVRFWVNESLQEASLSARISNITEIHQYPPLQEGADGLLGNNRIEMKRSGSKPLELSLMIKPSEKTHSVVYQELVQ